MHFELEVDNYTKIKLPHPLAQEHVMTNLHQQKTSFFWHLWRVESQLAPIIQKNLKN